MGDETVARRARRSCEAHAVTDMAAHMQITPWKEGTPSTPENLPARLMWFHERLRAGESTVICLAAPFVEAAEEIERLRNDVASAKRRLADYTSM